MKQDKRISGFMTISRLYMKMTDARENLVDDAEIELFIGSIDKPNLTGIINSQERVCPFSQVSDLRISD